MTTISRSAWLLIPVLTCWVTTTSSQSHISPGDQIDAVRSLKSRAIQLFNDSEEVQSALTRLRENHYRLLSTDAVAYQFAFGDEGPHASFLITAWLGKSTDFGWSAEFVFAKVNTDSFGPPGVTILDARDLEKQMP